MLDTPIVASEKKARPGNYGKVAGQVITHEQYGAVLQKDSKLTPMVSAADREALANGKVAKLQKKWFNVNSRRCRCSSGERSRASGHHHLPLATRFPVRIPNVWARFQVNLKLMVVAEALVLVLALAVAIIRGLPGRGARPLRACRSVYTDFFRARRSSSLRRDRIGLPALNVHTDQQPIELHLRRDRTELVYTAYVTEVYRAGIESVHPSQRMAARSLGLSYGQSMRHVVVPQAVRRVIPPLLNDFIGLQKDTALVS